MKTAKSIFRSTLGKAALLTVVAMLAAVTPAKATLNYAGGVDLGAAGRTSEWAIFALTGGISISDSLPVTFANPTVRGNLGVFSNKITLTGSTQVDGRAFVNTGGVLQRGGTAKINGTGTSGTIGVSAYTVNSTLTTNARNNALTASSNANGLTDLQEPSVTRMGWGSLTSINQNTNLSIVDNTSGAHVVLHLTDFVLTGGADFSLSGSASTTYIINIANKFSLVGGTITLMDGLLPEHVLFNVVGSGLDISLTSAAQFSGFLLAPQRNVNLSAGAVANGTIIAGKVSLSGGSKVIKPSYSSL